MRHTLLIVDDEYEFREFLKMQLKEEGFRVLTAEHGEHAIEVLEKNHCDLMIIDIMMPKMDGYELTKTVRRYKEDLPILLLTAKGQLEAKEKGFLAGTDDYLVKPFEVRELIFRIRALLRRYDKNREEVIALSETMIDRRTYEVMIQDQSYLIPLKEFELLFYLASHANRVLSRQQIIEEIWGFDYEGDERTVDVHIKRLRERFASVTDDF